VSREKDTGKRSFSDLLGLSCDSGEELEDRPLAKQARKDKGIPSVPKLSPEGVLDKVKEQVHSLKDKVKNLEEEVGTVLKNSELGKTAEERIKQSLSKSTTLKLAKLGFASEETVVKAFTKLTEKEEKHFSGLHARVTVLEKKEPVEPAVTEEEGLSSSKLRKKVREFGERVIKVEECVGRFDNLKADIISEAISEGKDFNNSLANQFVNTSQLKTLLTDYLKKLEEKNKAELKKVEEGFKAEIKALKATIEACEASRQALIQPAVDLPDLEGDASSNKRAKRDDKNMPKQKQAKLAFASLANDAAKPQQ